MKYLVISILIILCMIGCSPSIETVKENKEIKETIEEVKYDVDLEIIKSIGWIDLMPGSSPKFHISGKFDILKNDNYELEETNLKYIRIIQSGNELYYIVPKIIEETGNDKKNITYSTIRGLTPRPDLKINSPVDFELIFNYADEELTYIINDILVEEVQ